MLFSTFGGMLNARSAASQAAEYKIARTLFKPIH
jgi:hypothetical protein